MGMPSLSPWGAEGKREGGRTENGKGSDLRRPLILEWEGPGDKEVLRLYGRSRVSDIPKEGDTIRRAQGKKGDHPQRNTKKI